MATKRTRSKAKSDTPAEPAAETRSGPVTMTEALERLLPQFEGNPFEVAEWLDTKHRRRRISLLAGGVAMAPSANPAMLGVAARLMPDGKPVLYAQVRQALGEDYPIWDGETLTWDNSKKKPSLDKHHESWMFDRMTFEQHFPGEPQNRGGRSRKYSHEDILIQGAVVVFEERPPAPLQLAWLVERVAARLEGTKNTASDPLLRKVLHPLWKALVDSMAQRR
jgi:hypothetical protein